MSADKPLRPISQRHARARPWADVVFPICFVLLLAGFGAVLYTGRARGGFSRVPTRAEKRCELCRENLKSLFGVWRNSGTIPGMLWHERWGGQDGLGCANDDGAPYAVRDLDRFPLDAARPDEEPLAACVGLHAGASKWMPPHGDVLLVLYADGTVRDLDWSQAGLADPPLEGGPAPVLGTDSPSTLLRPLRPAR
jgi:hypothetical protein